MRRLLRVFSAVCLAAMSMALAGKPATATTLPQYVFIDLQQFGVSSFGSAINDSGQVAGSLQVDATTTDPFRYSGGVTSDLGNLGGQNSLGLAINGAGEVVGWSALDASVYHAFYWNGSALVDLKTLAEGTPSAPYASSLAYAVSDSGVIVGESQVDGSIGIGTRAFLYNGAMHQLPLPGAYSYSAGLSINTQGDLLVRTQIPGNSTWIYTGYAADGSGGSFTQVPPLDASGSVIGAQISDGGVVVGQATPPGDPFSFHAIRYAGGVTQDLGLMSPWTYSAAAGINDAGLIAGCVYNDNDERGAIYDGSWHDLNDLVAPGSGMVIGCAFGINNAGQITGEGLINGEFHAYLLTPSTATPLGSNVSVRPGDSSTGASPVTLTFSTVTGAGTTTLDITSTGPPVPSGYTLGDGVYYELSTTATYTGSITVCIGYTGLASPTLWHYTGGTWVQVTPVTDNGTKICGSVTSLSPFALLIQATALPPTADAGGPYSVAEGGAVVISASGTDPQGGALTFAWDLDGDGSFETPGQTVTFSAANIDGPASPTVSVRVTDTLGLAATAGAVVSVANVAPTVTGLTLPAGGAVIGGGFAASASFTDPAASDTHVTTWNWGDGTTSAGVVTEGGGAGTVSGSHSYATAGSYTVKITVTDDDGGAGSAQASFAAIYGVCPLFDTTKPSTGKVAPIKIALCDANGVDVSRPDVIVTAVSTTAPAGLASIGSANRGNRFRFDATLGMSGGYIYNLDTTHDPAGSYTLTFRVGPDPHLYTVHFTVG